MAKNINDFVTKCDCQTKQKSNKDLSNQIGQPKDLGRPLKDTFLGTFTYGSLYGRVLFL